MSRKVLGDMPIITGAVIERGYRNARRERAAAFSSIVSATGRGIGHLFHSVTGGRGDTKPVR